MLQLLIQPLIYWSNSNLNWLTGTRILYLHCIGFLLVYANTVASLPQILIGELNFTFILTYSI